MKFCIITHVNHIKKEDQFYGYGPYVREMNIWLRYVDEVIIVAPIQTGAISEIDLPYSANKIDFKAVPAFELTSSKQIISSLFKLPKLIYQIFKAMQSADHIHLRCPGNMGLLGSIVQIAFPSKTKSAKYAGNWDPKSKQPWSYRLQKWIVSNTFLTRNMQVLVYGEWPNSSKNIKPFFTASYYKSEIVPLVPLEHALKIRFVFAGSLVVGKNPQYAIQLISQLKETFPTIHLDVYGEGILRQELEQMVVDLKLESHLILHGNQNADVLKHAYQSSHFVLLPSKSEGWPKVIAEGMFWGCIPIATPVSCVPTMLDHGTRGIVLEMDIKIDSAKISALLKEKVLFQKKREAAAAWSRTYTLDYFEAEIQQILKS
ncbi:glycosyltransferase family 4 protein [Flavobacterium antarcticum]|uniref:glycosyltransferase family 4 protein n=1 Tax=Flavobacterium antarcticum TaxID=271155 RepID=UPI0003B48A17|nr:glycosyltransferase [Flavobacterium antarcticum]